MLGKEELEILMSRVKLALNDLCVEGELSTEGKPSPKGAPDIEGASSTDGEPSTEGKPNTKSELSTDSKLNTEDSLSTDQKSTKTKKKPKTRLVSGETLASLEAQLLDTAADLKSPEKNTALKELKELSTGITQDEKLRNGRAEDIASNTRLILTLYLKGASAKKNANLEDQFETNFKEATSNIKKLSDTQIIIFTAIAEYQSTKVKQNELYLQRKQELDAAYKKLLTKATDISTEIRDLANHGQQRESDEKTKVSSEVKDILDLHGTKKSILLPSTTFDAPPISQHDAPHAPGGPGSLNNHHDNTVQNNRTNTIIDTCLNIISESGFIPTLILALTDNTPEHHLKNTLTSDVSSAIILLRKLYITTKSSLKDLEEYGIVTNSEKNKLLIQQLATFLKEHHAKINAMSNPEKQAAEAKEISDDFETLKNFINKHLPLVPIIEHISKHRVDKKQGQKQGQKQEKNQEPASDRKQDVIPPPTRALSKIITKLKEISSADIKVYRGYVILLLTPTLDEKTKAETKKKLLDYLRSHDATEAQLETLLDLIETETVKPAEASQDLVKTLNLPPLKSMKWHIESTAPLGKDHKFEHQITHLEAPGSATEVKGGVNTKAFILAHKTKEGVTHKTTLHDAYQKFMAKYPKKFGISIYDPITESSDAPIVSQCTTRWVAPEVSYSGKTESGIPTFNADYLCRLQANDDRKYIFVEQSCEKITAPAPLGEDNGAPIFGTKITTDLTPIDTVFMDTELGTNVDYALALGKNTHHESHSHSKKAMSDLAMAGASNSDAKTSENHIIESKTYGHHMVSGFLLAPLENPQPLDASACYDTLKNKFVDEKKALDLKYEQELKISKELTPVPTKLVHPKTITITFTPDWTQAEMQSPLRPTTVSVVLGPAGTLPQHSQFCFEFLLFCEESNAITPPLGEASPVPKGERALLWHNNAPHPQYGHAIVQRGCRLNPNELNTVSVALRTHADDKHPNPLTYVRRDTNIPKSDSNSGHLKVLRRHDYYLNFTFPPGSTIAQFVGIYGWRPMIYLTSKKMDPSTGRDQVIGSRVFTHFHTNWAQGVEHDPSESEQKAAAESIAKDAKNEERLRVQSQQPKTTSQTGHALFIQTPTASIVPLHPLALPLSSAGSTGSGLALHTGMSAAPQPQKQLSGAANPFPVPPPVPMPHGMLSLPSLTPSQPPSNMALAQSMMAQLSISAPTPAQQHQHDVLRALHQQQQAQLLTQYQLQYQNQQRALQQYQQLQSHQLSLPSIQQQQLQVQTAHRPTLTQQQLALLAQPDAKSIRQSQLALPALLPGTQTLQLSATSVNPAALHVSNTYRYQLLQQSDMLQLTSAGQPQQTSGGSAPLPPLVVPAPPKPLPQPIGKLMNTNATDITVEATASKHNITLQQINYVVVEYVMFVVAAVPMEPGIHAETVAFQSNENTVKMAKTYADISSNAALVAPNTPTAPDWKSYPALTKRLGTANLNLMSGLYNFNPENCENMEAFFKQMEIDQAAKSPLQVQLAREQEYKATNGYFHQLQNEQKKLNTAIENLLTDIARTPKEQTRARRKLRIDLITLIMKMRHFIKHDFSNEPPGNRATYTIKLGQQILQYTREETELLDLKKKIASLQEGNAKLRAERDAKQKAEQEAKQKAEQEEEAKKKAAQEALQKRSQAPQNTLLAAGSNLLHSLYSRSAPKTKLPPVPENTQTNSSNLKKN